VVIVLVEAFTRLLGFFARILLCGVNQGKRILPDALMIPCFRLHSLKFGIINFYDFGLRSNPYYSGLSATRNSFHSLFV